MLETTQVQSQPGVIDLGIGQPQLALLPRQLMLQAAEKLLARADNSPLNYGHGKGDGRFRQALADFLAQGYGSSVDPTDLMATNGASGALHLISQQFAQPGDTILVEEPTYFLAHKIFADRGLKLVGVPLQSDGLDLDALEEAVKEHNPAFLYTIPVFQNPSGVTLSAQKRKSLVELAKRHNFLVVADEVYQLLPYTTKPPPPLACFADSGVVLSVGSFSKILAPGLRLGWIQTHQDLQSRLLDCGLLRSGGGLNHFMGCMLESALVDGSQQRFLEDLRQTYRHRIEVMDSCLKTHFGDSVRYRKPQGGFFFWLEFPEGTDCEELAKKATEAKTGLRAGARFSTTGGFRNFARLCFAHFGEDEIKLGIERLAGALGV